jgi:hypothetical protein
VSRAGAQRGTELCLSEDDVAVANRDAAPGAPASTGARGATVAARAAGAGASVSTGATGATVAARAAVTTSKVGAARNHIDICVNKLDYG